MYFIQCTFMIEQNGPSIEGFAVCSDPDTPVTFIHPDGKPHIGEIWVYNLRHYSPWAKLEIEQ